MKNRLISFSVMLAALGLPLMLHGQGTPSATGSSVAVINIQQAIATSAEGKQALDELQKKYQPRRQDLQQQQQAISALQDQAQRGATTLSDDEKFRLSHEIQDKQRLFKRAQEDANSDFQADSQEIIQRIGKKMVQVINKYAQGHGLSLVLDDSQLPLYYVAKGTDITAAIVKLYDQANPIAAATNSGSASPAQPKAPAKH
ncbi:MAG TPA: OmpH family outer membrane protein [Terriglobia bacterium]|nr:OmpH family outer membrane protein [Terriglobia bacterium]